ncbi:hypothetical protein FA95DRAFT_804673 [Auriscalpium vulgare]|uniref:Uncharacterized protein n=1 Tax=Auriscalpium vulgare TaxID=40419 RepID=A0ACB8R9X0_9AGAM|nr:hypothetical protein FA95DRAFT_804673 [Auriscalpium vulgare]
MVAFLACPGFIACLMQMPRTQSWLVIWEAGIIIELPPWVLLIYPSSLFYHFNVDISDIKFVTTENGEQPTLDNSRPIEDGDEEGRGSLVWFNMSSMFQASETGFSTLKEAKAAGHSGKADAQGTAKQAFAKQAKFFPIA